ncbi:Cd2+/Zn2+-exporting ATPase [Sporobacter termitidis DSM 10068]|uniref:Cd2+/Zn2+-exporting ATPase n=1 Tax=Sporobacter termitidis DSM 10068 TaxID=1123282 RepID=A0A1M5XUR7_9FIRM|nr:heavy metal translocating P-type ATPase [Sporobacter termitidis]SHI03294.1 Cd2+/Zn2+-exporting ATPase [Sporobacter termitidis DSM 10068]
MEAVVRKEYILNGLCCPTCTEKMQKRILKLEGVTSAAIDFSSQKLTMEVYGDNMLGGILEQTSRIVRQYEPEIEISEVAAVTPGKRTIYLLGLCCASCAGKIEARVARLEGVKAASVDFAAQKLLIEAEDKTRLPAIIRQASKIALEVEPAIQVSFTEKQDKKEEVFFSRQRLLRIGLCAGAALFAVGIILPLSQPARLALFLVSYLLVGGEVVFRAARNISRGQVFDENFLMSIATIGAFVIGEYPEGVAVMLFYQIGEAFQRLAVNRSRKSISALMDIRPDFANLKVGDEIQRVSPEEVGAGDYIIVRPGEKVPLDGVVVEGRSALDTSALTGEALPRDVEPGSEILSGSINKNGLLTVEVSKEFGESTVSKILDLVQNASSKKSPMENFVTKFARYYTPVVVFAAVALALLPPLIVPGALFADWLGRALVFLVVSCPCALVISIPLSFFGGIGGASKNGILIKGSNYLEALNNVDTVIFDKTGTLTKGIFKVSRVEAVNDWTEDELLTFAAHAESNSSHPIAVSVIKAYGQDINASRISEYEEIAGQGVRIRLDGREVLAGNGKLLDSRQVDFVKPDTIGTVVYLAVDGLYAGCVVISDEVKADSQKAVKDLKAAGVRNIAMLTGDSRIVGEQIGREIGLDTVYAELLPHQKVEQLELLEKGKTTKGKLVFVGDGINDAPVLARADVGIAMGGVGSDAAIEAADVVLMTDEPSKIVTAVRIAKKTRSIVWQNIIFALGVKAVILILGAAGIATMWAAVFGDVGVAVIAILNAMRALRVMPSGISAR